MVLSASSLFRRRKSATSPLVAALDHLIPAAVEAVRRGGRGPKVPENRGHLLPVYVLADESDSMRPYAGQLNSGMLSLYEALRSERWWRRKSACRSLASPTT